MKKMIHLLLALSMILSGPVTIAAPTGSKAAAPKTEEPAKVEGLFRNVIYDLDHVDDVVKDLDYLTDEVASEGISKHVMIELNRRLTAAMRLVNEILLNDKLGDDKRKEYLADLNSSFGAAMAKIMRFQKEDRLDDPRLDDYGTHPDIAPLLQKLENKSLSQKDRIDLQDEIVAKLDKLEKDGVPAPSRAAERSLMSRMLSTFTKFSGRVGREAGYDFKAVFSARITAEEKHVWTLLSRSNQDIAAQNALRDVVAMTTQGLGKMNTADPMLKKMQNFWTSDLNMFIRERSERLSAQRTMFSFYYGMAALGFFCPMVDMVGMLDGWQWSDSSLMDSGIIYAVIWGVVGTLKLGSYSGRTVGMLKAARDVLKDPHMADPAKVSEVKKRDLYQSIMSSLGLKKYSCQTLLDE